MSYSLVGEKTIAMGIAQDILNNSVEIPSIPEHAQQLFTMVRQPGDRIDIPEFVHLVESDPGLFTQILQLANSPYYRGLEDIVTLRGAITRIGLKEAVNIVCLGFLQKMLPRFPWIDGFSYIDFWAFSWACANANRRLGHPALGMGVRPGDLYMTGMLQGLGKLLMAIHFPDQFRACIAKAWELECPIHEIERDIFGTTDGLVAGKVLQTWQMPLTVCEGVGFYQTPELADPEYKTIAGMTQYALSVTGFTGIGKSGDGIMLKLPATFLGQNTTLRLAKPDVQKNLVTEISTDLNKKVTAIFPNFKRTAVKTEKEENAETTPTAASAQSDTRRVTPKKKKSVLGWFKSFIR